MKGSGFETDEDSATSEAFFATIARMPEQLNSCLELSVWYLFRGSSHSFAAQLSP